MDPQQRLDEMIRGMSGPAPTSSPVRVAPTPPPMTPQEIEARKRLAEEQAAIQAAQAQQQMFRGQTLGDMISGAMPGGGRPAWAAGAQEPMSLSERLSRLFTSPEEDQANAMMRGARPVQYNPMSVRG